jgi:hypothetical protein
MSPEEYAELEKKYGKDNPAVTAHKWQLAVPEAPAMANGPYVEGGVTDTGWGLEGEFSAYRQESDYITSDQFYGEGKIGSWKKNGSPRYGLEGRAGMLRNKFNEDGFVSAEFEGPHAYIEANLGEEGVVLGGGANMIGGSVTVGSPPTKENKYDQRLTIGWDHGTDARLAADWDDTDGDGKRNYRGEVDLPGMPVSIGLETEDPELTLRGLAGGGIPPELLAQIVEAEQQKNQAEFIAKRDKELADLEKNKEQIMKKQGAQAYYHKMFLANSPPQVRSILESAASTEELASSQGAPTQITPTSPQDQSLEFMTQMHEMMAAQRQ